MGKIRTRVLGYEDIEEQQKKQQKERSKEKKVKKFTHSEEAQQQEVVEQFSKKADIEVPEEMKKTEKKEKKLKETPKQKKSSHGKKYKDSVKQIDQKKLYSIEEAVSLLKKVRYAHFDESVELHINVEKKGLKGEVELPHATGKSVRVRILDDATLDEIEQGTILFDILIAHPSQMAKLAKFAKILGPKGLMPNPKAGTVTPNPEEVAKKFEKGAIQWKTEPKFPLIHHMIAKTSLDDAKIVENAVLFLQSVGKTNMTAAFMTTTMGPSLKIDVQNMGS